MVHLGSGSNSIDSQKERLLWFDLSKQVIYVAEYGQPDLLFADPKVRIVGIVVRAIMNNTIHVQVEVIYKMPNIRLDGPRVNRPLRLAVLTKFWDPILCYKLRTERIAFAEEARR